MEKKWRDEEEWRHDCLRYWNKTLRGDMRHYCVDWDFLPIDETCMEFKYCGCFDEEV